MSSKDGGTAFPHPEAFDHSGHPTGKNGMSLRDYYAGQVMVYFLQKAMEACEEGVDENLVAQLSYDQAEAMIAEREKRMEADEV